MEIEKPKKNMTKEELFDYLWKLVETANFNFADLERKIEESRNERP